MHRDGAIELCAVTQRFLASAPGDDPNTLTSRDYPGKHELYQHVCHPATAMIGDANRTSGPTPCVIKRSTAMSRAGF